MICPNCGICISTGYFNKHTKTKRCRIIAISKEIEQKDLIPIECIDGQRPAWFFVEPWPRIKSLIQTYPVYNDHYNMQAALITKYIPGYIAEIMKERHYTFIEFTSEDKLNVSKLNQISIEKRFLLDKALKKINDDVEFSLVCQSIYLLGSKSFNSLYNLIAHTCS